jgi:hypothetical protein
VCGSPPARVAGVTGTFLLTDAVLGCMAQPKRNSKYGDAVNRTERPDVFRTYDSFPAGDECDRTIDEFPDDEDAYGMTDHYVDRRSDRQNPDITDSVVSTILNGAVVRSDVHDFENPRYLLQTELDGYEWTIVIADDRENEKFENDYTLITVFSNYHGSVGTTNRYFDRLDQRRGDDA